MSSFPFLDLFTSALTLLVLILFTGCSEKDEGERAVFDTEPEYTLVENQGSYSFDNFYNPVAFRVIDDKLYLTEGPRENSSFHVLNVGESDGSLSYEKAVGRKGRGPAEFVFVQDFIDADSVMYIYDRQEMKLVGYDKEEGEIAALEDIHLNIGGRASNIYSISDNRFLGIGAFTDGRFEIINADGSTIDVRGELINFDDDFSPVHLAIAWVSHGVVHPDQDRVYLFSFNADLIDHYDFDGNLLQRIQGEEYPVPQMELRDNGARMMPLNDGGIISHISVDSDEQFIYALYSGEPRAEAFDEETNSEIIEGDIIHKFDWELNLVEAYKLNQPVRSIASDGKGGIYGFVQTDKGAKFLYYNFE